MSDEQMPVWAKAMEARAESREARDHHLFTELSGALAALRADMKAGFDRVHDDVIVSMDVADQAHRAVDLAREDISANRRELVRLWKRLTALELSVFKNGGPKPPEQSS